ncbi:MAG: cysteine synthase A [Clostridia bacterium]|nr:cysteine synthase A [Clostridia bacterium]
MRIYKKIYELIGNTPLLEVENLAEDYGLGARVLAKLEYFNPAGSAKDRIGKAMLDDAAEKGLINENTVIIEPTSGNTGIGLASVAASRGYKVIFTMPETMSVERRKLLSAYGARIVLTDGSKGMSGAIEKAIELAQEYEDSFIPSQFENAANPAAHRATTGVEIWNDTDGKIDIFVAGIGTGGTISGVGEFLKSKNPDVKIVGVEPHDSPVITQGRAGAHGIQGIGAGFIPKTFNPSICDAVMTVATQDALEIARAMAKREGVLVGISSGAALWAAFELAKREENKGKIIVALLPDSGERYLSTSLFE